MQHRMRWITFDEMPMVLELSKQAYLRPKSSYPASLNSSIPSLNPLGLFLIPGHVTNHDSRKILGVFDDKGDIILASGIRLIEYSPVWLLSWTISTLRTAALIRVWKQMMEFLTSHFEKEGINEFYVVSPVEREGTYRRLMEPLRERYWTFVETTIKPGEKPQHGLHWLLLGQQLYQYDINLRRYIRRRS